MKVSADELWRLVHKQDTSLAKLREAVMAHLDAPGCRICTHDMYGAKNCPECWGEGVTPNTEAALRKLLEPAQ